MTDLSLPHNWQMDGPEETSEGSVYYTLTGQIAGKYNDRTLSILVYTPACSDEWIAKGGKGYKTGGVPTFGRGTRPAALQAAARQTRAANREWVKIDGFELPEGA